MKSPLLIASFFAACGAGGWLAGRAGRPVSAPSSGEAGEPIQVNLTPSEAVLAKTARSAALSADMESRWQYAEMLKKAGAGGMESELKKIESLTNEVDRAARRRLILLRWAEIDARGMVEKLFLKEGGEAGAEALQIWAQKDPQAALEWTAGQKEFTKRMDGSKFAFNGLAAGQPDVILRDVKRQSEWRASMVGAVRHAGEELGMRNPQGGIEALAGITEKPMRIAALSGLGLGWARIDPNAAIAWAKTLQNPGDRAAALNGALTSLGEQDPKAAIQQLDALDPGQDVATEPPHRRIAAALAKVDFEAAAKWVKELDPKRFSAEQMLAENVLPALENPTPTQIVQLFSGVNIGTRFADQINPDMNETGLTWALLAWQPASAADAMREAAALPQSEARDCMQNYLAWRWAQNDPAGALAQAAQATGPERERLAIHASAAFAKSGDISSLLQIPALGLEPDRHAAAMRKTSEILAQNHPDKVAEFLSKLPEDQRMRSVLPMVESLVKGDPQQALTLASQLPADQQAGYFTRLSYFWSKEQPAAATRWIESLPAGPARDAAAASLISTMLDANPAAAFSQARQMTDPAAKLRNIAAIYTRWKTANPVAAAQQLRSAGLTTEQLAAIQRPQPLEPKHP